MFELQQAEGNPLTEKQMSCSRSLFIHLMRGAGAAVLIVLAVILGGAHARLLPPLLIGAIVLMRGCPMCWLMGLAEAAKPGHDTPRG